MDYGPGIGAVSNNGGVLICGGEKNVMRRPLDNSGGKVYNTFSGNIFFGVTIIVYRAYFVRENKNICFCWCFFNM